jgi:hypothetical protein
VSEYDSLWSAFSMLRQRAWDWWRMKRPDDWTLAQHLADPTVNCVTREEELLGDAVAKWVECDTVHAGERKELLREKGEAEALLGFYGAGGTPAGLTGGIHNLAHRAEKAEVALGRSIRARHEDSKLYLTNEELDRKVAEALTQVRL